MTTGELFLEIHTKTNNLMINQLIQDISRNGNEGIGKPEALRGDLSGWWSRRIDDVNRVEGTVLITKVLEKGSLIGCLFLISIQAIIR